jgi:hypothetical protein
MDLIEVLRKKLRERMNDIADAVSTGTCRNYEEYQRLCGVIEGLAHAERDLLDLKETMERNDE